METIHDKGSLLVHAEEKSIIDCMKERFPPESSDMTALSLTRPNIAEQLAVENVLAIAKLTGTRLCIAHTSSKETVAILERERAAGNHSFYLESCPHYMHFTRKNMEGPMGALYTMNPPLRSQQDADALLAAMIQEKISILSTDHCPYSKNYKLGTNYETVPCGVDGVQTRMLFGGNITKQPCFDELKKAGEGYRIVGDLHVTDRIMNDTFWIGVYPGMTDEMIDYMVEMIKEAVK